MLHTSADIIMVIADTKYMQAVVAIHPFLDRSVGYLTVSRCYCEMSQHHWSASALLVLADNYCCCVRGHALWNQSCQSFQIITIFLSEWHQVVFIITINDPLHTIFWLAGVNVVGNGYDGLVVPMCLKQAANHWLVVQNFLASFYIIMGQERPYHAR